MLISFSWIDGYGCVLFCDDLLNYTYDLCTYLCVHVNSENLKKLTPPGVFSVVLSVVCVSASFPFMLTF